MKKFVRKLRKGFRQLLFRGWQNYSHARTDTGAGLKLFLEKNLVQFEASVAAEVQKLASEVSSYDE